MNPEMLNRYDESELLDLIEGELDPRSTSALQQRLAGDPQARAMIEAMMRDRSALRAVGEPALPHDFLAQIEPLLARPMLIEHVAEVAPLKPGEFRRRYRRARRGLRVGRLAAAAVLLLATLGGAWVVFDGFGLMDRVSGERDRFAGDVRSPEVAHGANSDLLSQEAPARSDRLASGIVHHDRPSAALMHSRMAVSEIAPDLPGPDERTLPTVDVISAEFAIVLNSRDPAGVEAALTRAVSALGDRAALVRNFSFAEAQRLAEKHRLAHGGAIRPPADAPVVAHAPGTAGAPPGAPIAGVVSGSDLYDLAQRVRDQLRSDAAAQDESVSAPLHPAGDSALAPTLEQQLDFSSRGATYTMAMPASELISLIERLSLGEGQSTLLQMLPAAPALQEIPLTASSRDSSKLSSGAAGDTTTQPMLLWLTEGPRVRQAMDRLSRENHIVLVPVMVR
jgi:hypothetical protein